MADVTGGATNITRYFMMRSSTNGTAAVALIPTEFNLQYTRTRALPSTKIDATACASVDAVHVDNTVIEVDATDQPGLYRVDWPDAAFVGGVDEVILTVHYSSAIFTESLAVTIDPPTAAATQTQIDEIHRRLDLDIANPNTHTGNTIIANDDFTLTRDNTGLVTRTDP